MERSFIKGAGEGVINRGDIIPEGVLFGKLMFIPLTVLILYMQGLHNSGDFYTKEQYERLPRSSNAWEIFNPTGPGTLDFRTVLRTSRGTGW